ncbi:M14 family metallopeptidase [Sphingomonas sp.]|uniref:M14 family metallopeptidase n=1 Tax=Sphingomonas sp. TaxID=28214 RepID=UPI00286C38F9|nr:M14 family metallopeptidase [Sphingomonas sp.]
MLHLLAALAAIAPAAADLTAPLPPIIPWHGASERLVAAPSDPWITPAEAHNFDATPSFAETRAWLDRLVAASPLLHLEVFGHTAQGRELYAIRAAKPGPSPKPVMLAQAGIHSGEIDGKDAGLMLLRDIALRGKNQLLDHADFIFVPVFNADGHERSSPFNRPNQRGPVNQGWRTTAQNLNLNRDYLKADTPEMKAMLGLLHKYKPALYLDLHVTDGTDYQYDITFMFPGWGGYYAHSPQIGRWLDRRYRPAVTAALASAGHIPGTYVDTVDGRDPDKGIRLNADQPRYSTGYADLARIPSVLVEAHSLKPYRQRVLGTYVLVEESLRLVGAEGAQIEAAIAADSASRPQTETLSWKTAAQPLYIIPDFKGVAHERYKSLASGGNEVRWLGRKITQRMPVFGQVADVVATLPAAWWVPVTKPEVIALLRLHGIVFETITAPRTMNLDMVRVAGPKIKAADEGHIPLAADGYVHAVRRETFPVGSLRVPSGQPLGLLAAAMLEPESQDSLLAWNFFPEILMRTEYIEGYAIAPLAERMLAANPALKREFEAKLASDPKFAADPDARLGWFYERTPYYDERFLLYPVGRELKR